MASNSARGKSSPRSSRRYTPRKGKPSPARPSSSASIKRSRSRSAEPGRARERSSRSRSRSAGPGLRTRSKNKPWGTPASEPSGRNATAAGLFGPDDHRAAARGVGLSNVTVSLSDQSSLATTYRLMDHRDDDDDGDTVTSRLTSATELPEGVTDKSAAPKKKQRKKKGKAHKFTHIKSKSRSHTAMSASSSVSAVIKRFGPRKPGLTLDPRDRQDMLAHLDGTDRRPVVHVDVCASPTCTSPVAAIKEKVTELLEKLRSISLTTSTLIETFDDPYLQKNVKSISITECDIDGVDKASKHVDVKNVRLLLHVYQLHSDGPSAEELEGEEDMSAANHWLLPSVEYNGLWESLVFDSTIKKQLLHYASTTLLFSNRNVNSNIITWNRVVLLHGPPGTGKTSLCKALAQKLVIRLSGRFRYGQLVEINSHGLFSKWFSESGKLVVKMFQKIKEITNDPEALVCILIDEVESLTVARQSAMSGNEPSDAVRVVNALLTQIDQIKRNSNVIILATTNITGFIDLAFVDRADIKQYIGPPSTAAIYTIYSQCIEELMRAGIVSPRHQLLELKQLEQLQMLRVSPNLKKKNSLSFRLWDISDMSQTLSGRTLRKIPFLAHALYIQVSEVTIEAFFDAMVRTVKLQFREREDLGREMTLSP